MTAPTHDPEAAARDLQGVAADYGLVVTHAEPLPGGMENTHIKVTTTGGTVVITCLRKKTPQQADQYALFLRHLNALPSIPAPRLRQRLDGAWTTRCHGLPAIVCDFADGVSPCRFPSRLLRPAGLLLARIHHDTAELANGLDPHLRLGDADADTLDRLPDGPFARWARQTWDAVHDVPHRNGPRGYIHADVFPDNIVIQGHDGLVLLDWEDGSRDLCALDAAVAVLGLCCHDRFSPPRTRQLLAGYRDGAVTKPDMTMIRDAALYAAVLIALRRYRWQAHGHGSPDPLRSATVMARIGAGLARDWAAALP